MPENQNSKGSKNQFFRLLTSYRKSWVDILCKIPHGLLWKTPTFFQNKPTQLQDMPYVAILSIDSISYYLEDCPSIFYRGTTKRIKLIQIISVVNVLNHSSHKWLTSTAPTVHSDVDWLVVLFTHDCMYIAEHWTSTNPQLFNYKYRRS